jgi:hypothetical protein
MKTEYLFHFCADTTALGTLPAHYLLVSKDERKAALHFGGKDVSDNQAAWEEFNRENNADNV